MPAPRIIHQIWMQGWDQLPAKFHANIRELTEKNPEYQVMRWDADSLRAECKKLGPAYVARYDSYKYMMSKVDFGRYVVLYNWGGISVDTDMKPLGQIDDTPGLAEYDFIVSGAAFPSNKLGLVNNAVIITRPHHSVLRAMLDDIVANPMKEDDVPLKEIFVHNTTGPLFLNRILTQYRDKVHVLDNAYYEPCMSVDPYCTVGAQSIMDHQHELSWMDTWIRALFRVLFTIAHYWWVLGLVVALFVLKPWALLQSNGRTRTRN